MHFLYLVCWAQIQVVKQVWCISLRQELVPSLASAESAVLISYAPKVVCNYMQDAMRRLCPLLVSRVSAMKVEERNLTNVVRCFDD